MLKSKVRAVTIATKDKDIKLSLKKNSKVNRMSYSSWMSIMNCSRQSVEKSHRRNWKESLTFNLCSVMK